MKNKIIGIVVCMLLISTVVSSVSGTKLVEKTLLQTYYDGNTLYVGGNGTGNYTTIQEAIDNASKGDTVFVYNYSSPYYENVVINKDNLTLFGEDKNSTIINGSRNGYTIVVDDAENVTITGFSVTGSSLENWSVIPFAGIKVSSSLPLESDNCWIYGNNIYDNQCGIVTIWPTRHTTISQNEIFGNKYGFYNSKSSDNVINSNTISSNNYGIMLDESENVLIANNRILYNNIGIYGLKFGYRIQINHNEISNNSNGIELGFGRQLIVQYNEISDNDKGIYIDLTIPVWIRRNTIINNDLSIELSAVPFAAILFNNIESEGEVILLKTSMSWGSAQFNWWGGGNARNRVKPIFTPFIFFPWLPKRLNLSTP